MDSFHGAPRRPPTPPTINSIGKVPVVPEVSIIDNSSFPQNKRFAPCSYNPLLRPQNRSVDKEQSFLNISKKHVRFHNSSAENFLKENVPQTINVVPDLNGKTFKQIYMANVPDRHLDLSIFEPPNNENVNLSKPQHIPEIDKLKSIENLQISPEVKKNYFEWSKEFPKFKENKSALSPRRAEISIQTDPIQEKCTEVATNDEPTIRDLFKIIQQQNEQIMLLQRQVNNLKTSIRQPEIEGLPNDHLSNSPNKKLFSFDVKATSFEFSFRPQQKFRKGNEFLEPKIQEIVENDNIDTQSNFLQLDESLDVKDSYVSNVPSIAIEMDDYQSSEDDEPQIGLSFYKDLMNQVNNALKKAQKQSEIQTSKQEMAGQTMKAVKQATLQHLKNIGINLSPIRESTESVDFNQSEESDISCAVQQLLMKYLPSDKLAKVVNKSKDTQKMQEKFKPPNTEFSFATLQYMKKYNLIDKGTPETKKSEGNPKILDVTALKLQPKLL